MKRSVVRAVDFAQSHEYLKNLVKTNSKLFKTNLMKSSTTMPCIQSPLGGIAHCFALALCGLLAISSDSLAQDANKPAIDPSGTWRWEYEYESQTIKDQLKLELSPGNSSANERTVEGKYESSTGRKRDIRNGKVVGSSLTFEMTIDYKGMDVQLAFTGSIKNDTLTGTVKATSNEGALDLPWNANRSVQNDDVLGTWKLRIDANGQLLEPVVTISKEGDALKARYKSGGATELALDAQKVKIDKNELCFSIEAEFQGTKIKADFMGRPYGERIQGNIDYVLGTDVGEVEFTGKRQPENAQ